MNQVLKRCSGLVLAVFVLGACATPAPVRDLASKTAANVTQVGTQLKTLGAIAEGVAAARARNVARLKATVREVRKGHALDIALTKKSGDSNSLTVKNDIAAWMIEARAAARDMTVEEFKEAPKEGTVDLVSKDVKAVMDSLESLDSKAEALGQVAKKLAALNKKDDLKARARFMIVYVKEVRSDLDEKQKAAAAAATAAKSKAENTGKSAGESAEKATED